ncbi:hypothetical protein QP027_06255 [Corynebacterium breve]|uniref:Magnesium transporter n=1 Tax=Corynebacterium breve TaxID=3049799 RepID=A0ABY8VHI4_9CORY|nr:hypothetical protein [Corynebacterium breve]WIM68968.1 hypothetical protein QP027_06255 [Corynebacterium breve]
MDLVDQARLAWLDDDDRDGLHTKLIAEAGSEWKQTAVTLVEAVFGSSIHSDQELFEKCFNAVTDLTWKAREMRQGFHNEELIMVSPEWARTSKTAKFALTLIELQLHRFNFDSDGIRRVLDLAEDAPLRFGKLNLNHVFLTFSRLLAGRRIDPRAIYQAVGIEAPEGTDSVSLEDVPVKIKHLLLHAMWLFPQGEYGEEMLVFSESILADNSPSDFNAHYRRAEAYRRLAATRGTPDHDRAVPITDRFSGYTSTTSDALYAEALRSIHMAIKNLPADANELHAEFVTYRMMIATERQVHDSIRRRMGRELEHVRAQVDAMSERIEQESRNGLLRSIEILALFLAVIGIMSFNISMVGLTGASSWERIGLVVLFAAILFVFYWLVHVTVYRHTHAEAVVFKVRRKRLEKLEAQMSDLETKMDYVPEEARNIFLESFVDSRPVDDVPSLTADPRRDDQNAQPQ